MTPEELFAAARRERASDEARARTLRAALGAARNAKTRRVPVLYAAAGLALAAASAVLVMRPANVEPVLLPEPAPPRLSQSPPSDESASQRVTQPSPAPAPAPALVTERPAERAAARPTLRDEVAALQRARSALATGDARRAIQLLDHYDKKLRGTQLTHEATLLRVEALAAAGQQRAASALARRFVDSYPTSPLADRARSFTEAPVVDDDPRHQSGDPP